MADTFRSDPGYQLLWSTILGQRRALARILLWSVVESLPILCSGLLVAAAVERFTDHEAAGGLGLLGLLLLAVGVGAVGTRHLFPQLAAVVEKVREAFTAAVVAGTLAHAVVSAAPADMTAVARIGNQIETLRRILFVLLRSARQTAFTFIFALAGLAMLEPTAALVCVGPLIAALTLFGWLVPRLKKRNEAVLTASEEVSRRTGAAFSGIRDVVACGAQEQVADGVLGSISTESARIRSLSRLSSSRAVLVFLGGQIPLLVLLAAAPVLLDSGRLDVAELIGAATYLMTGLEPALRGVTAVAASWGLALATIVRRLGGTFAPRALAGTALPLDHGEQYELSVRELTFAYGLLCEPVVRDLNLDLMEGDHLAVIGASGIGKSTLADLMCGLLAPQGGVVLVGGRDVRHIPESQLRQLMTLIPQEAYVFAASVRDNLAYLVPGATDGELIASASAVGMGPLMERLGGLDAYIGPGGARLSAGEKQLVALARVHASRSPIVILDEATSHLDPAAECMAEMAFANRTGTVVIIAHRLSSARRAKRILLLDGSTAHLGSHDQLLSRCDAYRQLVTTGHIPMALTLGGLG